MLEGKLQLPLLQHVNTCKKLGVGAQELKERLKEIHQKGYIDYLDGSLDSIKFLKPREDRTFSGKWWNLFEQIQKNKLQKWEEMKFYTRNHDCCKMKLILTKDSLKTVNLMDKDI